MSRYSTRFVSIADLYLAYRKAKAEAFFETTHHHALAYVQYEQHLHSNLERLLRRIQDDDATWSTDSKFVGTYIDAPKSIDDFEDGNQIHFHAVDPLEDWRRRFEENGKKRVEAKFRMLILATVDMQIISALWIIKAGFLFDSRLNRKLAYGNRLRGSYLDIFDDEAAPLVGINRDCVGLFVPYFSAYRQWRENGLEAMRQALLDGNSIVAITMDVRQFYHRVSPNFLLRKEFLETIGLELDEDQHRLTRDFLTSLGSWYKATPDYKLRPDGALPVGLSASKIISNVLLCEFDRTIAQELNPIYYGRYVDDIFLVLSSDKRVTSGVEVMRWLADSSRGLLRLEALVKRTPNLRLVLPYAEDSDLVFSGEKQKIFYLDSQHGLDLIEQIVEQIRKQSSEHRLLEDLPDSSADMASRALLATPDATLAADALRKADVVSVRRLGFSLLLRDVEAYARDLQPSAWSRVRTEFYGLVHRHLLTPKGLFDYTSYIHRVFGLMIACGDCDAADRLLEKFELVMSLVEETSTAGTVERNRFSLCKQYYVRAFVQAALQATTVNRFKFGRDFAAVLASLRKLDDSIHILGRMNTITKLSTHMLNADLGRRSYKDYWYYSHREDATGPRVPKKHSIRRVLRLAAIRRFRKEADLRVPFWPALAFPTRPLSVPEITLIAPALLQRPFWLKNAIMALRGAGIPRQHIDIGLVGDASEDPPMLVVPNSFEDKPIVAVSSVETTDAQWSKALNRRHDRSLARYRRLKRLINRILEEKIRPHYVTFPECSLPRRWALQIASKLATNGISLLAGLEYYRKRGRVRNDCLLSLTTNWPGYRAHILRLQPKLEPAHAERRALSKVGSVLYQPTEEEKRLPVYLHGRLCFAALLCSDLTNIQNRRYFQGHVDALFVLEWNPDVPTFSFLVEATAHDVHAFVIQVNNRLYGDSRIRVPYKEEYKRDAVRVKGGTTDYYVLANIDFLPLRDFQRKKSSSREGLFKPVPIGFKISETRQRRT